jgi:hypothetical protein
MRSNEVGSPDVVVYMVGGSGADPHRNPALRDFPLVERLRGESKANHLARLVRLVNAAISSGGTHLLVPRELADWLGEQPWLADYLGQQHKLVEANAEVGIVFALCPGGATIPSWRAQLTDILDVCEIRLGRPPVILAWGTAPQFARLLGAHMADTRLMVDNEETLPYLSKSFEVVAISQPTPAQMA